MRSRALRLLVALALPAATPFLLTCGGDSGQLTAPSLPAAPTGLVGTPVSSTRVDLAWVDTSPDETSFRIERKRQPTTAWTEVDSVGSDVTHFRDTGLQSATAYVYRVRAERDGTFSGYSNDATVTTLLPPRVSSRTLPHGLIGAAYGATLEAVGGTGVYTWEVTTGSLPGGLALDSASGVIGGVPVAVGTSTFRVQATSAGEAGTAFLGLTVLDSLRVTTTTLPDGWMERPYSRELSTWGGFGSKFWSVAAGTLPGGLVLDTLGVLGGTPTAPGTFDFVVRVRSEDGQVATADLSMAVDIEPVSIITTSLSSARVGVVYHETLEATGGVGPYSWSVAEPGPPAGITLDGVTGTLDGMPEIAGRTRVTLTAEDSEGRQASGEPALTVCEAGPSLSVGESIGRSFPDDGCGVVLGTDEGDYRVALMSRRTTEGATPLPGGLTLDVSAGTPGVAFPAMAVPLLSTARIPRGEDRSLDPGIAALAAATERFHRELREEEYRQRPNATAPRPSRLGPPLHASGMARADHAPAVKRSFWVRDPETRKRVSVSATLRASSPSLYYYEDDGVVGAATRATDPEVQVLLDYYEAYGRPIIDHAFGGLGPQGTTNTFSDGGVPLTLPADDIDRNGGRVIVLQIRPALMRKGVAAYVSGCDRRPRPENLNAGDYVCGRSNQAEIVYMRRPRGWFYLGSLVHEAKHVWFPNRICG